MIRFWPWKRNENGRTQGQLREVPRCTSFHETHDIRRVSASQERNGPVASVANCVPGDIFM